MTVHLGFLPTVKSPTLADDTSRLHIFRASCTLPAPDHGPGRTREQQDDPRCLRPARATHPSIATTARASTDACGERTHQSAEMSRLVCHSDNPLRLDDHGELHFGALQNLLRGAQLGASQVTAVVRRDGARLSDGRRYRVALRASLVWPYLVRLTSPAPIKHSEVSRQLALPLA